MTMRHSSRSQSQSCQFGHGLILRPYHEWLWQWVLPSRQLKTYSSTLSVQPTAAAEVSWFGRSLLITKQTYLKSNFLISVIPGPCCVFEMDTCVWGLTKMSDNGTSFTLENLPCTLCWSYVCLVVMIVPCMEDFQSLNGIQMWKWVHQAKVS